MSLMLSIGPYIVLNEESNLLWIRGPKIRSWASLKSDNVELIKNLQQWESPISLSDINYYLNNRFFDSLDHIIYTKANYNMRVDLLLGHCDQPDLLLYLLSRFKYKDRDLSTAAISLSRKPNTFESLMILKNYINDLIVYNINNIQSNNIPAVYYFYKNGLFKSNIYYYEIRKNIQRYILKEKLKRI